MGWLKTLAVVVPLVAGPIVSQAQTSTLDWQQLAALPAGVGGEESHPNIALAGSFVGVHNNALIIAGGVRVPDSTGHEPGNNNAGKIYYDKIRVATREPLTCREAQHTLPEKRAFGATASHALGVIVVGGTDGRTTHNDVHLLRWNNNAEQLSVLELPAIPNGFAKGGAAVIGNILYVMAGSNGDLYALDLSRIKMDANGVPLAEDGVALIKVKQDLAGRPVNPWQQLPSIPQTEGDTPPSSAVAVVAQNDGRGDRLFAIGVNHANGVWAFNPDAEDAAESWVRKADVDIDGKAGSAIALGQQHILLLTGANDQALAYNAITDAWTSYQNALLLPEGGSAIDNGERTPSVISQVVNWNDSITLIDPGNKARSASIWNVSVQGPERNFGWLNMTVLFIYLLAMVMVGVYFAFKNKSTDDYFRGGQHIPWWAAACSMYATMLSSLTYVALPALVYRTDWLVYLGTIMILVVAPIAIYIAMPFFRQIDATSAYEYLSKRFNMAVRLFASGLFTLFHIGRMGIVMALTALALAAVTPLDAWQCVLIMGVLCLIYCTLGGVEAVIWTDTIQTVVLLIGALLCFSYILSGIDGGFSGFIDSGMAANKFTMVNLDFGPGSITTLSIWVIVLGGIGQNLSSYTADQAVVQRYMVTTDTKAAARSIWANGIMAVPGALLFFCIGTGLYCFYQSQPDKLDPTIQIDQIFPTFIATELPVGIAGLIVAGIFAAAQSTVSTSMNSLATTLVTDFMRPFNACRTEKGYLNAARALTFAMGVLGTLAGLIFISPEIRSLMEEYFKVIGMFMGALGGLFVLGVATRKANGLGAMVGIFAGVGLMLLVWQKQWADGYLFATIGILTCLLVGYVASLLLPSDQHDLEGLTLYTMRRDQPGLAL
ncbi:MAG: sodium:solute symporter family transporter [Pseudomonadales bacterium]